MDRGEVRVSIPRGIEQKPGMLMSDVFEKFVKGSPVAIMARALMERALEPQALDALFREQAERQYEKELLFSSLVDLMALVVCGAHPSVRQAYQAMREQLPVTLTALYAKLNGVEVGTSEALVAHSAQQLRAVMEALGTPDTTWLPGYRIKALDGNHLAATERRLAELRGSAAGPLPGQALVVLEPELGLVTQIVGCEDGHAQERSLLAPVLAAVQDQDVYLADRNFCTLGFLFGVAERRGFFVLRQHAHLPVASSGTRHRRVGRTPETVDVAVQHDQLHVVEPHVALGDEVGEAAGARDGDVDAVRERAQLLAEPDAAVEGGDGLVGIGELAHLVADLRRQLTGGGEHEGRGRARAGTPHALHEGDAEGEGLAGAGGRPAAHVAAGERRRDRPGLDGERLGDATPREAGGDVAVDAEGLEPACCGRGARGEVGRGGRRGRKGGGHRLLLEVFVAPSWGRARSGAR